MTRQHISGSLITIATALLLVCTWNHFEAKYSLYVPLIFTLIVIAIAVENI